MNGFMWKMCLFNQVTWIQCRTFFDPVVGRKKTEVATMASSASNISEWKKSSGEAGFGGQRLSLIFAAWKSQWLCPWNVISCEQNWLYSHWFIWKWLNLFVYVAVALNFQTAGTEMDVYQGRFQDNGFSGYVLKPEFLRDEQTKFNPKSITEGTWGTKKKLLLKVRIEVGNLS